MSKLVKELIIKDYEQRFGHLTEALVIDIRGINANDNNAMRLGLLKKDIRVTVVKNTLARKAFQGKALEALGPALTGPAALAYGAESVVNVARELVEWAGKVEKLQLKAAVLDGQLFEGDAGVRRLSDFPTREEAQARVVQIVLSPGGRVVGAALAPGSNILGIVKEIQERLEEGKSISKVG